MKRRTDLPRMQLQSLEIGGLASHCEGLSFLRIRGAVGDELESVRDRGTKGELLLLTGSRGGTVRTELAAGFYLGWYDRRWGKEKWKGEA